MKHYAGRAVRPLIIAAGLTVGFGGLGGLAFAQSDEPAAVPAAPAAPEAPKVPKPVHRKITVVGSDDGVTVREDGKIIIRNDHAPIEFRSIHVEAREKALKEVQSALDDVNARLAKAKNKDERKALESAVRGLEASVEALKSVPAVADILPLGNLRFDFDFDGDLEGALSELQLHDGELDGLKIELQGDMAEARAEIAEALEGLEIEVDRDGDLRKLKIRSLRDAARDLDSLEEQHLEGLKRAQEDLARARADLEKRIAERKARKAAEKDGDQ